MQIVRGLRQNGPDEIRAQQIPLAVQLVAVADFYWALVTERPYRAGFSPEQALAVARDQIGNRFTGEPVQALEVVLEQVASLRSEDEMERELAVLSRSLVI